MIAGLPRRLPLRSVSPTPALSLAAVASVPVHRARWHTAPSRLKSIRPVLGDVDTASRSGPPGWLLLTMLMPAMGGMPLPVAKTAARDAAGMGAGRPLASVNANESPQRLSA